MQMYNLPHQGEIIREFYLEPLGLTVTETAKGLGVNRNTRSELLNGNIGISPEMTYRLAKAFGRTPESWLTLQTLYNLAKVREKGEKLEIRQFFTEAQPI